MMGNRAGREERRRAQAAARNTPKGVQGEKSSVTAAAARDTAFSPSAENKDDVELTLALWNRERDLAIVRKFLPRLLADPRGGDGAISTPA